MPCFSISCFACDSSPVTFRCKSLCCPSCGAISLWNRAAVIRPACVRAASGKRRRGDGGAYRQKAPKLPRNAGPGWRRAITTSQRSVEQTEISPDLPRNVSWAILSHPLRNFLSILTAPVSCDKGRRGAAATWLSAPGCPGCTSVAASAPKSRSGSPFLPRFSRTRILIAG